MTRSRRVATFVAAVSTAVFALAACGGSSSSSSSTTAPPTTINVTATLNGAGSTFQQAYDEQVAQDFKKVAPNVTVNYAGGGSGAGQTKLADQVVDFAGTDVQVKPSDMGTFKGGPILYFPTVAAPITVSYNLPGVSKLQLSGDTIAGIFGRTIKTWNDPKIAADNPGVTLPSTPIVVVHRADASGTTANFTAYLVKAAPGTWKLGTDKTVQWSSDTQGGNGNGGVAQAIKTAPGGVGYVDFSDAKAAGLTFASIKNTSGAYVAPTLAGATAAIAGAKVNPNLTYDPLNATGASSYPITSPTYIIVYQNQTDANKGQALKAYLDYILTAGQATAAQVDFAALPSSLAQQAIAQLNQLQMPTTTT